MDNAREFSDFVARRQAVGLKKYGHGVRREDDTRAFGTTRNCWLEMAQEELGDAVNYVVCERLRANRRSFFDRPDDNLAVLRAIAAQRDPRVVELTRLWYSYEKAKAAKGEARERAIREEASDGAVKARRAGSGRAAAPWRRVGRALFSAGCLLAAFSAGVRNGRASAGAVCKMPPIPLHFV